ncbi:DUF4956 domain-containing protein [Thalassorhabdus alkalitolerans]|uniref:DUF4956 domain-containing protein n=1 Tax=Thalassorhabdus alkalitolerans TaxID=2282697 RepID=A0ABW0YH36_9BACI|nr:MULTISPECIES: DUF4956 domain-containing protein [Bacillaceae]
MNQFSDIINQFTVTSTTTTLTEAFMAIILSFVLSMIITVLYKHTYKGSQYSQSFVHTIIIMSVVVSIVMIVIGNNIAVAFGLVGAFSIIRFRSAMSDPKDIAFIFFGMAAGIASGLGFYMLAILFTLTLSFLIYVLYVMDYGSKGEALKRLRITIPENLHYEDLFTDIFEEKLEYVELRSVETTNLGTMIQLDYSVRNKEGVLDKELMDAIRERNANLKVSINFS